MDCFSVKQAAMKWNISERCVQKLCETGRIQDAVKFGNVWMIPKKAKKPVDGRSLRYRKESVTDEKIK